MNITNLKDLSKLIDLCRKKGIESISVDNVTIKLGPLVTRKKSKDAELQPVPQYSEEDLINWSVHNFDGVG